MKKQVKKAIKAAANKQAAVATTTSLAPFHAMLLNLDLEKVVASTLNPRKEIGAKALAELTDSIRQHGVQTPIKVRPTDNDRYELVYGERRYRASLAAGKQYIPAYIHPMTDEEAKICAVIENMQRADFSPFEEAEIFRNYVEKEGWSIACLSETFAKSESYIRKRMNLVKLIPPVVEMLQAKDISLEVAFEFAKYDQQVQTDVYNAHFKLEGWDSWKGIKAKEFAKRLYRKYMTHLKLYNFDKTDCTMCHHNTLNQPLFRDCAENCGACQNRECLTAKNKAYLIERCITMATEDPYLHLGMDDKTDGEIVDALEEKGFKVEVLTVSTWHLTKEPEVPTLLELDPEDYKDEDDLEMAKQEIEEELEGDMRFYHEYKEELRKDVIEGRSMKYALIDSAEVVIYYYTIVPEKGGADDITTVPEVK